VHGELQILEHFLGYREVVIRSAGDGEIRQQGDDHHELATGFSGYVTQF
jgi:hypothetical protein